MKNKVMFIILILLIGVNNLRSTTIITQAGEDTFNNPVIWADVPDPSVIRVDDTYYMSSTTMHMNPGLPIMKSHDLVNWEIVNYVYDVLEKGDKQALRNGQNEYGQGSWASSLRYHNGTFYVAVASFSSEKTYIFQTEDIENGEWTRSTLDGVYHDMSLLFDDDGRVYMIYGGGDIHIIELTADATMIKPGGMNKKIISDAGQIASSNPGLAAEGAHLQKINDYYYIFLITWPQGGIRTQLVYRADEIDGEYEGRVALSHEGIAQGGVVDTADGDWYGFLFGDRGSVGRIPYLVPVTWEDDWPVFGIDGEVPEEMFLPVKQGSLSNPIVASDEFEMITSQVTNEESTTSKAQSKLALTEEKNASKPLELIENGSFEEENLLWTGTGNATVEVSNQKANDSDHSLFVSERTETGDGPKYVLSGKIKPDKTYHFSAKIMYSDGPEEKTFNFNIQNGPSWQGIDVLASETIKKGEWGTITGTYVLPPEQESSETFIFIETAWSAAPDLALDLFDFYIDDVTFVEQNTIEFEAEGEYESDGSELSLVWQWNHNPDHNYWTLIDRPGYLRLINGSLSLSLHDARNTLTQRTFGPESSGHVALDVSQMQSGDVAGLAAFQANYGYVGVRMEGETKSVVMVNGHSEGKEDILASIPFNQQIIYLKVDLDFNNQVDQANFYYSLNGDEWTAIGETLQMSYTLPHFMGYRFGLFNYATENLGGYVDYDYFRVTDQVLGVAGTGEAIKQLDTTQPSGQTNKWRYRLPIIGLLAGAMLFIYQVRKRKQKAGVTRQT